MDVKKKLFRRSTVIGIAATSVVAAAIALPFTQAGAQEASSHRPAQHGMSQASQASRLIAIAKRMTKINGDSSPDSATVVATTHARALTSATPGDTTSEPADTPVYLLTIKGHFTIRGIGPQGAPAPAGTYLSIVVDARSYRIMDLGLSRKSPAVSPAELGHVTRLTW